MVYRTAATTTVVLQRSFPVDKVVTAVTDSVTSPAATTISAATQPTVSPASPQYSHHPQRIGSEPPAPYAAPAWEDVVRDHGDRVFRLSYRLTGNRHDAEDLTQEVFVRVFRSLSQYTPGTFEGWLHRITTNLFLDQVRRKARIRFDALPDDAADRMAGREPGPAQVYDDSTFDADVQSALDKLPADFRAAVVLCDIEGLSYEEIAELLNVKLGTVRSRIHRGRSQLRQALAHRTPTTGTATRLPTPHLAGSDWA
jgi:RNA polymerase sigma factor (sigma-70 family)